MGQISKFFIENQSLFSNPQGTPEETEKFNLYGGLATMAEAIEDIQRRLTTIEAQVKHLHIIAGP